MKNHFKEKVKDIYSKTIVSIISIFCFISYRLIKLSIKRPHSDILMLSSAMMLLLILLTIIFGILGQQKCTNKINNSILPRFFGMSKKYIHYYGLDFDTPIDCMKINDKQSLQILTEINGNLIPKYLKYNKELQEMTIMKKKSYNSQTKQDIKNTFNEMSNKKDNLKNEIHDKTQTIFKIESAKNNAQTELNIQNRLTNIKKQMNKMNK